VIDCACWRSRSSRERLGGVASLGSSPPLRSGRELPGQQRAESDQVVRRHGEGEDPVDQLPASMPQLAEESHRLAPAEAFLHPLAALLTRGVARVPRGPGVQDAAGAEGDMRGPAQSPEPGDETPLIVPLVRPQGAPAGSGRLGGTELDRLLDLRGPARRTDGRRHPQAVAIVQQHTRLITELGFLSHALLRQSRVGIGHRAMGRIRAALAPEAHRRIARIIVASRGRPLRGTEALLAGPGLQQRPVDGEVLLGEQGPAPGLAEHPGEEGLGDLPPPRAGPGSW
jgi:hypothetical protein